MPVHYWLNALIKDRVPWVGSIAGILMFETFAIRSMVIGPSILTGG